MMGEVVTDTWLGFGNMLKKNSRPSISWDFEKPTIGILAFEVSRLMSKVIHLWQCLSDRHMLKLKEEITNLVGIQKLISEEEDHLIDLALAEIIDTFVSVAKSVVVLGKKCPYEIFQNLDQVFIDPFEVNPRWYDWQYRLKKMERKVRKMEKFVASTEQLFSELEVLAELEQNLKRIRVGANPGKVKLFEFQQKVSWQRQEVRNLQEMSPWVRSHDYVVRLLFRSLSTIMERIKYVYGVSPNASTERSAEYEQRRCLTRSNSLATLMQASICTIEKNPSRLSAHLGRSLSNLGLGGHKNKSKSTKPHDHYSPTSITCMKKHRMKARLFSPVGFTGCMTGGLESPVLDSSTPPHKGSFRLNFGSFKHVDESCKGSFFDSKRRLLKAPPSTLGHAALSLHYANIIILIEKLSASPHLISLDARDDLYNMLPASIRSRLRAKLKTFSRSLSSSSVFDSDLAHKWSSALTNIFEWLSPLAHNMLRWQSEHNFERQRLVFGSNVLLVHTLYFAKQVETEEAIVELLTGLNYLARFGKQMNEKLFRENSCNGTCEDSCKSPTNKRLNSMVDLV